MKAAFVIACVVGFMIANVWSSVHFKFAADSAGKRALFHFIVGNLIGALAPIALTLALRRANANVVYALCFGGAFSLLQIVLWRLFQQPLSTIQWIGITCVGVGIFLLQIRPGQAI
ncbi:MAG: hypothetical protein L0Y58_07320 [Verrucomicrobia subdivision 3 bacterium]|nr:hypothetical protein [Limisphaerales bacterium]